MNDYKDWICWQHVGNHTEILDISTLNHRMILMNSCVTNCDLISCMYKCMSCQWWHSFEIHINIMSSNMSCFLLVVSCCCTYASVQLYVQWSLTYSDPTYYSLIRTHVWEPISRKWLIYTYINLVIQTVSLELKVSG